MGAEYGKVERPGIRSTLWRDRGKARELMELAQEPTQLWFGKKENWLGFGPIRREGRAISYLYVLLVVVAIFTYSNMALTALVAVFYTVVFGLVVIAKSDLMRDDQAS